MDTENLGGIIGSAKSFEQLSTIGVMFCVIVGGTILFIWLIRIFRSRLEAQDEKLEQKNKELNELFQHTNTQLVTALGDIKNQIGRQNDLLDRIEKNQEKQVDLFSRGILRRAKG